MDQSWESSGSAGLVCGSMFTTALVEKLTRVGVMKRLLIDPDGHDDLTEDQEETLEEVEETLYEYLIKNVDRRCYEHGFTLGAQGESRGSLEEGGDELQHRAPDETFHPQFYLNQDSSVTEEQKSEDKELTDEEQAKRAKVYEEIGLEDLEATQSAQGKGNTSAHKKRLISRVFSIGTEYLSSYQGFDDTGDDGGLHNVLRMIQSG